MDEAYSLRNLLHAARELIAWLNTANVEFVIIGGVAASILGRARLTKDVDALAAARADRWPELLKDAAKFGFQTRVPDAIAFAEKNRLFFLSHVPSETNVDVGLAMFPFELDMIRRRSIVDVDGIHVPLPTPGDLIVMKCIAGRPMDLEDVSNIIRSHPERDHRRIRKELSELAEGLSRPEILSAYLDRVEKNLRRD